MNKKGQVLILFVLSIPVLVLLSAYIVDNVYIAYNKNRLNQINELVIEDASKGILEIDDISEYVNKNDKDIDVKFVYLGEDEVEIILKKDIKSLFGRIIGQDSYSLTSDKKLKMKTNDGPLYQ